MYKGARESLLDEKQCVLHTEYCKEKGKKKEKKREKKGRHTFAHCFCVPEGVPKFKKLDDDDDDD